MSRYLGPVVSPFALRTFHTSGECYRSLTVLFGLLQYLPDVVRSALLMVGCEHKDARQYCCSAAVSYFTHLWHTYCAMSGSLVRIP